MTILKTTYISHFYRGVQIGHGSTIYYKSSIVNTARVGGVIIGSQCIIGRTSLTYHAGMPFNTRLFVDGDDGTIIIGDNCHINGACIHAKSNISLGNKCVVASGVHIIDSNGHEVKSLDRRHVQDVPRPISIGNNVWIGLNVIILKGTIIGDNAVIYAGSVVKGEFPANCIIAGNPAKIIKNIEYY